MSAAVPPENVIRSISAWRGATTTGGRGRQPDQVPNCEITCVLALSGPAFLIAPEGVNRGSKPLGVMYPREGENAYLSRSSARTAGGRALSAGRPRTVLAGQVELARLVDLCAERLGLKIEYDPKDLQGATVTLRLRDGISDDELWEVTNHLLASRGFTTVQLPGGGCPRSWRCWEPERW